MKKLCLTAMLAAMFITTLAQETKEEKKASKEEKKEARRERINQLIRQAEEGVLIYNKQSTFGVQLRNNGYGLFYELGKLKTNRKTNIYRLDITEIKDRKEEKSQTAFNGFIVLNNPYVYGKINNFYQATLGFGQQRILGQKGNKNGVAVSLVYSGGLAIGLLRPYYLEVIDGSGQSVLIKYEDDNDLFLDPSSIIGGGGIGKGWGEMKVKPGAFLKTACRFDYGRYNEVISGLEIGLSAEFYGEKIPIMALQSKDRQLFIQGYLAIIFGKRK
ncbi:MAG TPA: hypothetical protein PLU37_13680 [Chitinophagaceae bacterium]|nr:hypothetical protein [Chitinophagaceae bacterium]MCB9056404.1 hypothetical protein [Chitinophagales bacterium]HPG12577.1 hypothetical protein [Chitinophagaceae bacterium]HRX94111.1 hypothetical protein [Chitinophagaceae bacterium]